MRKLIYILLFSVIILGPACDSFLEEIPKSSISPANFYKTSDDALAAVNGAYAALQDNGYYSRYWVTSSTHASDGSYSRIAPTGDRGVICTLNDAGMITSNRYNISIWKATWQAVNRANSVLDHVGDIEMDETLKARILGEAKFLRALSYFNMVRRWGDIPLVLSETNSSDLFELQVSRTAASGIYDQIEKDLSEAVGVLPLIKDYASADIGRASKEAAQGLLAKVQLYRKDWSNAKTNAVAVINSSSNLDLMDDPKDNWWQGNGTADNNKESIFEVQYNGISPQGHQLGNNYEPNNSGWGPGAWGTIHANLYFFNKFSSDDKRKPATFLTVYPSPPSSGVDTLIQWQENTYPLPHINKFRDPDNKVSDGMAYNIKILRFADVLLVAAEASNESDDMGSAYQYVNRVRTRAGLPDLSGLSKDQLRDSIYWEFRKELCYEGQDYEELVRQGRLLEAKAAACTYTVPTMYKDDGSVFTPDQVLLDRIKRYQPQLEYLELDPWNVVFPIPLEALDKNPNLVQTEGYK